MTIQEQKEAVESLKEQISHIEKSIKLLKLDLNHANAKLKLFTEDAQK